MRCGRNAGQGIRRARTKADVIVDWLKADYGPGRGHAMALVSIIRDRPEIGGKHVDSGSTHSDPSSTLRLTGQCATAQ